MSGKIYLFSIASIDTTARYLERAVRGSNGDASLVCWDQVSSMGELHADDTLFFVDPAPDWPLGLERAPCLTVMYLIDVRADLKSKLRMSQFFDVVFVAQKDYVARFHEIGHRNAYWLPVACDPVVHHFPLMGRPYDLGFVGKLGLPRSPRHKILTTVLPRYHTNDYNLFYSPSEMAKLYGQSKIVFNASMNGDLNMRIFEAMASGALLVTDRIQNGLPELFQEGVHYVGYSTIEEAIERIDYYLKDSIERERIALEGQRVALTHHTYLHRWEEVIKFSRGKFGQAPARTYSKDTLGELYSAIFASLRLPRRIADVVKQYGLSTHVLRNLAWGWGRWLNARVPITPNAMQTRLRTTRQSR